MNDERRCGLSAERIEHILNEAGLELPIGAKECFHSRVGDILEAIGIEGGDEFGSAFVSALDGELSPGELAVRLKKIERAAGRLWKALSDPLGSLDGDGTDIDVRTANIEVVDALVLESRVAHIRETGEPAPISDASFDIGHVINRIGDLEKIATKAASRARMTTHQGQPRKEPLDAALISFANVYCEFVATRCDPFDLEASEANPFIRMTHAALGRSSHSVASLVKRWERLRAAEREVPDT